MKAEDIAELIKSATTLLEHDAIIARFDNMGVLNRVDALAKYRKFNNEHPDFYAPLIDICERQGSLADLGETNNKTIVENMKYQRDWLYKKSVFKFGEEEVKRVMQQRRSQFPHDN